MILVGPSSGKAACIRIAWLSEDRPSLGAAGDGRAMKAAA